MKRPERGSSWAGAPLGATSSGDDPPLTELRALAFGSDNSIARRSLCFGGRFAFAGSPDSANRLGLPDTADSDGIGCPTPPSPTGESPPDLPRFQLVPPVGPHCSGVAIAGETFALGRSSGAGRCALSGTRHTVPPAFSLVKRYFVSHRVIPEVSRSSTDFRCSSTGHAHDDHRVVHKSGRLGAADVDD